MPIRSFTTQTLDRIIAAATDTGRRDRTIVVLLAVFIAIWTIYGTIAKSGQDMHFDMAELIAWSRDLALGFPKHPPFSAVIVRGWFALFPISDPAFYLLAMTTSALSLWIAWVLFEDYLPPTKRLIGVVLLTFIPFFNFHVLKFNVNAALMPSWAVTTLWFLRSYRTSSPAYAALAGFGVAICMMTKYWSLFLLAGLGVAALLGSRRNVYFRSKAPWITAAIAIAAFSPHIGWLQKHGFPTLVYAMEAHGYHTFAEALRADLRYLTDTATFAVAPVAIVLLAVRPNLATLRDMAWPADPDRRVAAIAFWATLLIPTIPALFSGVDINGIWSMSAWTLLPVLLLAPNSVQISEPAARRILGLAIAFPIVALLLSPVIALEIHRRGLPPKVTQLQQLSEAVEKAWHVAAPTPLMFVGGDTDLADSVAAYAPDRPRVLPGLPQRPSALPGEKGVALVCVASDVGCVDRARATASRNPRSQVSETQLSRRFFGIDDPSERYFIAIVPPRDARP